jgi:hypothetical protein
MNNKRKESFNMAHVKSAREAKKEFWYQVHTNTGETKKATPKKFKKNVDEEAREKFASRPMFQKTYKK